MANPFAPLQLAALPLPAAFNLLHLAYLGRPTDPEAIAQLTRLAARDGAALWLAKLQSGLAQELGLTPAALVDKLYWNSFGRHAESAAISYWSGLLASGELSLDSLASSIFRAAGADDLRALASKLLALDAFNTGWQVNAASANLAYLSVASHALDWFAAVHDGASLSTALQSLNQTVAYTPPPPWVPNQQPGWSFANGIGARLAAPGGEGAASVVQAEYLAWLGRPADAGGLAYWMGRLNAGESVHALEQGLLASAEYAQASAAQSLPQRINDIYLHAFGRPADAGGLLYWADQLQHGQFSQAELGSAILASASGADAFALRDKLVAANAMSLYAQLAASAPPEGAVRAAWLAQVTDDASMAVSVGALADGQAGGPVVVTGVAPPAPALGL
ncbi:DUF4214 domain-containing protein [Massilia sp. TS11]|uniref:DUF4214 domain-containing protein n=1 Tax=Massilia sp. TS11 TaxID=2908003 RepID=UPI001ED9E883|nr:DUF4214 domain-containing protein [Massilia sp. TS11]